MAEQVTELLVALDRGIAMAPIAARLRVHQTAAASDRGRYHLLGLAAQRCSVMRLPKPLGSTEQRHAIVTHLHEAWELLSVPGLECPDARADVVRAVVDALNEFEREDLYDSAKGKPWAADVGLVDTDYDHDGEGYVDCSTYTAFGVEVVGEIASRW